jgi:hypothetical protein
MQLSGAFLGPGSKIPTGGDPKDSITREHAFAEKRQQRNAIQNE